MKLTVVCDSRRSVDRHGLPVLEDQARKGNINMTTKSQLELDQHLRNLLGCKADGAYHSRGAMLRAQGSTLLSKSTVVVPDSSRKAGLGDRH